MIRDRFSTKVEPRVSLRVVVMISFCIADLCVLGLASYYYSCYLKLTREPKRPSKLLSNMRNDTLFDNRTMMRVSTKITSANVGIDNLPVIGFDDILSDRLKDFAPQYLGNFISRFVHDSGYSDVYEGTKVHRGQYYFPFEVDDYKKIPQITIKNIHADVDFDPQYINRSWPLKLYVEDGLDFVGMKTNVSMPIRALVSCTIKVEVPVVGTASTAGSFVFAANVNASSEFRLSNMTIQKDIIKKKPKKGQTSPNKWAFFSDYMADVDIVVDTDSVHMTFADLGAVSCVYYGFDLCGAVEEVVVEELFGEGSSGFDAIINNIVLDTIEDEFGKDQLSFDTKDNRFDFLCDLMECDYYRAIPKILSHVSKTLQGAARTTIVMGCWIFVRVSCLVFVGLRWAWLKRRPDYEGPLAEEPLEAIEAEMIPTNSRRASASREGQETRSPVPRGPSQISAYSD